jgi:hypothetical protein
VGAGAPIMSVNGNLSPLDPFDRVRQQCHHKAHSIKLAAGKTYVIDLLSQYDNYLRLETAAGQQVAQDDDSGEGLNAQLTYIPVQSGEYRIIVTTCFPGSTGGYTLTVRER